MSEVMLGICSVPMTGTTNFLTKHRVFFGEITLAAAKKL